ncbi:hypothetical protein A3C91_00050 [Candidatus Azambacteria bacterium RIFCSPHIGHO2_02_FULL_52_12]|uniref:Uncharacterized protein n=1 Tax=Candidatus Azambacteria bacterium RIFCSPLOWO2_01_FULL_46_25 TaxID=1797298 RepID=A0A1F5BUV9_9BACT|nr:MAG: hypothetical protein A3C91_00050 [Candidatus Azambacteria bacterium RIFCSPHIGHO2_02_FULL_52_12]OGD34338.1 MAG: hypothetical protein A2988_02310 [Candidatus Azambacteria bacterium RIFCSPLOWO2_01_FULL_46_25]OGD37384.1 MAG: hypothetical protein A2850_01575 [Candidatus Azambacteria bacterium RIFCSPHIGHO2_01_FULL_51_74]
MTVYYKCDDAGPMQFVCNHVKEALHLIELEHDYFGASLHIQVAKNLVNEFEGWAVKLPDDYHMDDPKNRGFGYYDGNPPYAIIKFEK